MGYACPVCETPQRDGEHLAHHLAFTAMLGDESHEEWLDDHAPGWEESGPDELASRVVERAPETEYEAVFDDTVRRNETGPRAGPQPDSGDRPARGRPDVDPSAASRRGGGELDADAREILREAREMTEQLLGDDAATDADTDTDAETDPDPDTDGKES